MKFPSNMEKYCGPAGALELKLRVPDNTEYTIDSFDEENGQNHPVQRRKQSVWDEQSVEFRKKKEALTWFQDVYAVRDDIRFQFS